MRVIASLGLSSLTQILSLSSFPKIFLGILRVEKDLTPTPILVCLSTLFRTCWPRTPWISTHQEHFLLAFRERGFLPAGRSFPLPDGHCENDSAYS